MYDFFKDTATDQHDHDHDHGTAGPDADHDNGHNSTSESTHHDAKRNHHHEKESEDMKRTIKNSSAPILTGFALSVMFILCSAFNALAFDNPAFNVNGFDRVFATADFRVGNFNSEQIAQSFKVDALIGFDNDEAANFNGQDFARADQNEFTNFRDTNFRDGNPFDFDAANFGRFSNAANMNRFGVNQINDASKEFADLNSNGKDFFTFTNASFTTFDNDQFVGLDNGGIVFGNNFQIARVDFGNVDFDNTDSLNSDGFNNRNFVA